MPQCRWRCSSASSSCMKRGSRAGLERWLVGIMNCTPEFGSVSVKDWSPDIWSHVIQLTRAKKGCPKSISKGASPTTWIWRWNSIPLTFSRAFSTTPRVSSLDLFAASSVVTRSGWTGTPSASHKSHLIVMIWAPWSNKHSTCKRSLSVPSNARRGREVFALHAPCHPSLWTLHTRARGQREGRNWFPGSLPQHTWLRRAHAPFCACRLKPTTAGREADPQVGCNHGLQQ